ncbi:unnamed protein product [Spodoptera littoralis]|uniref:Uncharacterized protein n=1 Tax=Spodoptera littoralis TaxID=7109 RepID=A0A9P0HZI8_SPOLI|nr:unnamed protein product [Spodoptera littoralis]CAH1636832.1 unnamed protein product [Spodoptera littoralis]
MGNMVSSAPTRERDADNVTSESELMDNTGDLRADETTEAFEMASENSLNENEARVKAKEEEMNEFRKQLDIKREQRRQILARHRTEKEELEKALQSEKAAKLELFESNKLLCELLLRNNIEIPDNLIHLKGNCELTDALAKMTEEFDDLKANNLKLRKDLSETNRALQEAYTDIADLNQQNTESIKQIRALKEVVSVSKTMISLREQQLNDLKEKLNEIERTLADRETNLLSADLRQEYERQLQNIRTLRGLYEERARLAEVTRQRLVRELDEHKVLYQAEVKKSNDLNTKVEELESRIDSLIDTIDNKNSQISTSQIETNVLKAEMAVVNKLFSQVLLGEKTKQDLDTLVQRLEENHGILTQMAEKENGSEASSALPKLLLELVSQVDENEEKYINETQNDNANEPKDKEEISAEQDSDVQKPPTTTAEEIVENLPKVWKVLIELLSHQNAPDGNSPEKVTTCYKSVETKSGPVLVPSVSQTYIRLKDLILEKLGLIKEVNRMKQLNGHLETRLEEQERRLCMVTNELSKTWHVVGRLRRHHHQLHTHEKILKYELQQKRKLLNELKEELEYCREKWEQAREKNTQSERDWRTLRAEFSSRKTKSGSPSFNNSGESGYSDERPSDESSESNDESEYVAEPLTRCKRKLKKSFDSSTDFNIAEREDPASDMLDVADLPLDTQEGDDNHDLTSEPSKSERFPKNGIICEETEDEIGDITHDDSCPEESHAEDKFIDKPNEDCGAPENESLLGPTTSDKPSISLPLIDPAEILKNVRLQNERLAKKDQKLNSLESSSAALLKKTQTTVKISEQINDTLDHLINRPTTSQTLCVSENEPEKMPTLQIDTDTENKAISTTDINLTRTDNTHSLEDLENNKEHHFEATDGKLDNDKDTVNNDQTVESVTTDSSNTMSVNDKQASNVETPDFKAILENVRKQNERLAKKDERLQQLESSCSEVVNSITGTLKTGDKIIKKLETLHNEKAHGSNEGPNVSRGDNSGSDKEDSVPSTSGEIDHEARFAARDLRLKRLEEQTKSLVNKVNKTNSKGVKIHYKLEELHNIYGSESSRAGTPSEENEDKSNANDSPEE